MDKQGADAVAGIMALAHEYAAAAVCYEQSPVLMVETRRFHQTMKDGEAALADAITALVRERDLMRPVVDAAVRWHDDIWEYMPGHTDPPEKSWPEINGPLEEAIIEYRAATAPPNGEQERGG